MGNIRFLFVNLALGAATLTALCAPGGLLVNFAFGDQTRQSVASDESVVELHLLALVNRARVENGRQPLLVTSALARVARAHSLAMADQDLLEHQAQGELALFSRVLAAGEQTDSVGENIYEASGAPAEKLADDCVRAWMLSPVHHFNMLQSEFLKTGVAMIQSVDGKSYITEDFAH